MAHLNANELTWVYNMMAAAYGCWSENVRYASQGYFNLVRRANAPRHKTYQCIGQFWKHSRYGSGSAPIVPDHDRNANHESDCKHNINLDPRPTLYQNNEARP